MAVVVNGSGSGAGSWDDESIGNLVWTRTSNVILTLTPGAMAGYSIAGDETVTFGIPRNLVQVNGVPITGSGNLSASPATFVITNA